MPKLSRWLPFLNWPRPHAQLLRGELVAAVTVAVVMTPSPSPMPDWPACRW